MFTKGTAFITIVLLGATSAYTADWAIGLKGGLSKLEYHVNHEWSEYDSTYNIPPTISIFIETHANRYFEQQFGIGYFRVGGNIYHVEYGPHVVAYPVWETIKLDFLSLSYAIKVKINVKKIMPYLLVGSQFDYLINSEYSFFSHGVGEDHFHSDFNKTNFTPIIGFGCGYHIQKMDIFVEYQPYYHLMKFNKTGYSQKKEYITSGPVGYIGLLMPL